MLDFFKQHAKKLVWVALLGLGVLGYELYTIFNAEPGDTLSETVWWLLDWFETLGGFGKFLTAFFTMATLGLFGWLGFHFFGRRKV